MLFMINWSIDGSNVREVNDRFSSGKEKFFGIELVGDGTRQEILVWPSQRQVMLFLYNK